MSKAKLLLDLAESMRSLADNIEKVSKEFLNDISENEQPDSTTPEITLEQVRAVLAGKSCMGMTEGVRNLLNEFGAKRLSELKPKYYLEIVKRAEELNNGA